MLRWMFTLLVAVIALPHMAAANDKKHHRGCAAVAVTEAAKYGVAERDIENLFIDVVQSGGGDFRAPPDFVAWLKLRQCTEGALIVQMSNRCWVQQTYTRGECSIPGVPSY